MNNHKSLIRNAFKISGTDYKRRSVPIHGSSMKEIAEQGNPVLPWNKVTGSWSWLGGLSIYFLDCMLSSSTVILAWMESWLAYSYKGLDSLIIWRLVELLPTHHWASSSLNQPFLPILSAFFLQQYLCPDKWNSPFLPTRSHFHMQPDFIPHEIINTGPPLPHATGPSFSYLQIVLLALHFCWGWCNY